MMKCSDFTLLFAEDNSAIQKIYSKTFTQEGYRVLTCEHGARVLADLKEEKVDLLVTDLEMPGMNTLDLFPILKKEFPRLPVVVVSGHYKDLQKDFLDRGYAVAAFLSKPTEVSALKIKIREILKIDGK
jgi:two-component system, OmpR family, response regulator TctD